MWIRIVRETEIALNPKKPGKKSRLDAGTEIEVMPRVAAQLANRQEAIYLPNGPGSIVIASPAEIRTLGKSKARAKGDSPSPTGEGAGR